MSINEEFGDGLCAFTEFFNVNNVAEMWQEDFLDYVHDLRGCRAHLQKRMEEISPYMTNQDPTQPYQRMPILNEPYEETN